MPGDVFIDDVTKEPVHASQLLVDEDFVETLGLEMRSGRAFSRDLPTDQNEAFMITETTARLIGFDVPDKAIGHPLSRDRWDSDSLKYGKL